MYSCKQIPAVKLHRQILKTVAEVEFIISKPQLYLFCLDLKQNEQVKETLACDFQKSHVHICTK
jgi:hypothetical protein